MKRAHSIGQVEQHSKKGAKDTYTHWPACAILYMCIPQKLITKATIPTNQKSFRQKMPIVNGTNKIYGDRGCEHYPALVTII